MLFWILLTGAYIWAPLYAVGHPFAVRQAQRACDCTCRPIAARDVRDFPAPTPGDTWTPRHSWWAGGYQMVCASAPASAQARARLLAIQRETDWNNLDRRCRASGYDGALTVDDFAQRPDLIGRATCR